MANNTNNAPVLSLQSLLEKGKLSNMNLLDWHKVSGTNFHDWHDNLKIYLEQEQLLYVLDAPVPNKPVTRVSRDKKNLYNKHVNDSTKVSCLMLVMMAPNLQRDFEFFEAYDMIISLKKMFETQARWARRETAQALFSCKMVEGASVSSHVLKMTDYIEHLNWLGSPISQELATDMILVTLPESFDQFVQSYVMNEMDMSVSELHVMLKTFERNMRTKRKESLIVKQGKGQKRGRKLEEPKDKDDRKSKKQKRAKALKDGRCHHCGEIGHWLRNCSIYLEELRKSEANGIGISGVRKYLAT